MGQLQVSSIYQWFIIVTDGFSTVSSTDTFYFITSNTITDIEKTIGNIPDVYELNQNYPNPFNPSTNINFQLPEVSRVKLTVYDLLGRIAEVILDDVQNAGYYNLHWIPSGLSGGIYFYRLEAQSLANPATIFIKIKKMVYLK